MKPSLLRLALLVSALCGITSLSGAAEAEGKGGGSRAPLHLFDMVHHNPGEPLTKTIFLDPARLAAWGYDANIPRVFVQCAVPLDTFDPEALPAGSPERAWIEENARAVDAVVSSMKQAGLPCYPFTDFIVIPKRVLERHRAEICDAKGQVDVLRPRARELLRAQIDEIFRRFPDLGGLTVRHGETYLYDTPHHTGGNPILHGAKSHVALINLLREELCVKRGKRLFYRTWDFGFLHDKPAYYLEVTDQIEPHPLLVFSIKHQFGDFHRLSRFNPCLGIGKHPQLVEVQCQMEAYGKGAYPYYVAAGVIDGWEEYAGHTGPKGLRDLLPDARFFGVWTWSRGGGWAGPHITDEFWCELNAFVLSRWAHAPSRSEPELFEEFAREVAGLREPEDLRRFRRLAELSASAVLRSQNSLVRKLDVWWNRDEYFEDLSRPLASIADAGLAPAFLEEKAVASGQWREIESIAATLPLPDAKRAAFVRVSSTYGRIKAELIEQMCRALIAGHRARKDEAARADLVAALERYDALWAEWRRLREDNPGVCSTLYTDVGFRGSPGMRAAIERVRAVAPKAE